jgi:hypothetical protein
VSKDELKALQERVAQLEAHIAQLTEAVAPARALLKDTRRLEELGERAAQLSTAADNAAQPNTASSPPCSRQPGGQPRATASSSTRGTPLAPGSGE